MPTVYAQPIRERSEAAADKRRLIVTLPDFVMIFWQGSCPLGSRLATA